MNGWTVFKGLDGIDKVVVNCYRMMEKIFYFWSENMPARLVKKYWSKFLVIDEATIKNCQKKIY